MLATVPCRTFCLSKNIKIRIYKIIILSAVLYECATTDSMGATLIEGGRVTGDFSRTQLHKVT
jgi:hypothetical protein